MQRHGLFLGLALAAWIAGPTPVRAQVWTELAGTHNTAATAQSVGGTSLTQISGSLATSNELDVYRFTITTPTTFSATTQSGNTAATTDTMLFLFTSAGVGIASNDDIVNKVNAANNPRSLLPAGNALYANLAPGQYLLAVGLYNNRPTSANGTIFTNDAEGIFGPQNGGVFTGQTNGSSQAAPAAYGIGLTGVAPVPEPGTLLLTGATGLGAWIIRRRRRAA